MSDMLAKNMEILFVVLKTNIYQHVIIWSDAG